MHLLFWITFLFAAVNTVWCCDEVEIRGTDYQQSREGIYEKTDDTCPGQGSYPIYEQEKPDNDNYIFYTGFVWAIGSKCGAVAGLVGHGGDSEGPHTASDWWEVSAASVWQPNSKITCSCKDSASDNTLFIWIIMGVVIGGLVLILVCTSFYVCIKKCTNKEFQENTSTSTSRSNITVLTQSPQSSPHLITNAINSHQVGPASASTPPAYSSQFTSPSTDSSNRVQSSVYENYAFRNDYISVPPPSYEDAMRGTNDSQYM